jgi:hypothetical protein
MLKIQGMRKMRKEKEKDRNKLHMTLASYLKDQYGYSKMRLETEKFLKKVC